MQKVPYSSQDSVSTVHIQDGHAALPGPRRSHTSWIISLTVVCFIFGGLLAAQLRAVERVRLERAEKMEGQDAEKARLAQIQKQADEEKKRSDALKSQFKKLQNTLAQRQSLSHGQVKQLNARINELMLLNGLTSVTGPGVTINLKDNPAAAQAGGGNPFLPGIVHDFDLLQVVNELRAAKAEAIAINGRRISGFSPIRCVGPVIYINGEAAAPPFNVQAIGDTDTLTAALKMPNGIIDNLKNQGGLGIKITVSESMTLPAVESRPRMHAAKAGSVILND